MFISEVSFMYTYTIMSHQLIILKGFVSEVSAKSVTIIMIIIHHFISHGPIFLGDIFRLLEVLVSSGYALDWFGKPRMLLAVEQFGSVRTGTSLYI